MGNSVAAFTNACNPCLQLNALHHLSPDAAKGPPGGIGRSLCSDASGRRGIPKFLRSWN